MHHVGQATSTIRDPGTFTQASQTGFDGGTVDPGRAHPRTSASAAPPPTMPGGWRPAEFSLRWGKSGWGQAAAWSTHWDVTNRAYALEPPALGTWIVVGRQDSWNDQTVQVLAQIAADFEAQGTGGELVILPLVDDGRPRLSRAHALIVPNPDGTFQVTALGGNVTLRMPNHTVHLGGGAAENHAVPRGQNIRLAPQDAGRPAVVIRLG